MEDRFNHLVCRHFAKKVHCPYEDWVLCLLPRRVHGPPLWDCAFPSRLEGALCDPVAIYFLVALWWLLWGCSNYHPQSVTPIPMATSPTWGPKLCFITGARCALFLLIQPPEPHLQDPIFAPFNCLLDPLPPRQWTAEQETSLVLFLVHLSTEPPLLPLIPESRRAVSYHSLLLAACFKSIICHNPYPQCCHLLCETHQVVWLGVNFKWLVQSYSLKGYTSCLGVS